MIDQSVAQAIALLNDGINLYKREQYPKAEPTLLQALSRYEAVYDAGDPVLIRPLHALAGVWFVQERYEEAAKLFRRAEDLLAQSPAGVDEDLRQLDFRVNLLERLGQAYFRARHYSRAAKYKRKAARLLEQAEGLTARTLESWSDLAFVYYFVGEYLTSEALYKNMLGPISTLPESENKNELYAEAHGRLALIARHFEGRYDDAVFHYQTAIAAREATGDDSMEYIGWVARLANFYIGREKFDLAEQQYQKVVAYLQAREIPITLRTSWLVSDYAKYLRQSGRREEAKALRWQRSSGTEWDDDEDSMQVDLRRKELLLGKEHPEIASLLLEMAKMESEDLPSAKAYARRAVAIRSAAFGVASLPVAEALTVEALVDRWLGDLPAAREAGERASQIINDLPEANTSAEADLIRHALLGLAITYKNEKHFTEAEPLFLRTLVITQEWHGKCSREYAEALWRVAQFYTEWKSYDKAMTFYEELLPLASETCGVAELERVDYLQCYVNILVFLKREDEPKVQEMQREIEAIWARHGGSGDDDEDEDEDV